MTVTNVTNTSQGYEVPKTGTNVAYEIADFLFGIRSIEKIAKGEGSWGDLVNVGVTAATFLIPPAKLAMLGKGALRKVVKETTVVQASNVLPPAAARALTNTVKNAEDELARRTVPSLRKEAKLLDDISYKQQTVPTISETGEVVGSRIASARPTYEPKELVDRLNNLYRLKNTGTKALSDLEFKKEKAKILRGFFPEEEIVPMIQKVSGTKTGNELIKSTDDIIKKKKDAIIKTLEKSDNPDDVFLARELRDLDIKTLKQEVIKDSKGRVEKLIEQPSEIKSKGSAIGSELDQVLYDRETLQGLLTGELNQEATGKITAILRRWANETDNATLKKQYFRDIKDIKENKLSSNLVNRIRTDIDKLDNKAARLQGYIDEPYSPAALRQSEQTIPFKKVDKKTGVETIDYAKPRSYKAKESVKKSGKAPETPQRSTVSELKQDEESLMKLLEKETNPTKRAQLRKQLDKARKELFNAEIGRGRQYISDTAELQKELDTLRKQYMQAKNSRAKEVIKKRGQEIAARLKKLEGN